MRQPTYFISHGGGPWPWLQGPFRRQFDRLEQSLGETAREIGKPRAVLVITGHWEEDRFTVQSAKAPGMIYDYAGFPDYTYQITYPAPGSPAVAGRVHELLTTAGIEAAMDPSRGYDHGTFTPLYVMYPDADVPIVQLSITRRYEPEQHLAAGRALRSLRDEGVVILGSGLSWHNLRLMGPAAQLPSAQFDAWLAETLASTPAERTTRLRNWAAAPSARLAHPREDHFVPLMVALGAAEEEPAYRVYHETGFMGGVSASSYRFGNPAL